MAISVDTEFIGTRAFVKCDYTHIPDITPKRERKSGVLLPKGPGFPAKYEVPRLSFKVFKAMAEGGCGMIAESVVRSKRRSLITPNYIWDNIGNFAGKPVKRLHSERYTRALQKLRNTLDVNTKLTPLPLREASKAIPQSTSPGLPYIKTHPGWKKGDVLEHDFSYLEAVWDRVASGGFVLFPDSAAFARSHIGSVKDNKVRPVWAVPISVIIQEARFAVPLTQEFISQRCCRNTAYGCEMMKGGMLWLNGQLASLNCKYGTSKIFMSDYKAFDSSVPAWLIRDVFQIIMEKFLLTADDERKLRRCINYFINTPIQNSDGRRFKKDHGIPSGSMFTNLVGSLVNMVVTWYSSDVVFGEYPIMDIFFGDDGLACYKDSVIMDLEAYARAVSIFFGMTINTKKSYWTSNLVIIRK